MTAMASTEVERRSKIDTAEVPSAEWGWSGGNPRVWHISGILIAVFLFAMSQFSPLHGNHVGHVEDWYLVGFAIAILAFVIRDWYLRWRGLKRD
jgi:hypothetical protein